MRSKKRKEVFDIRTEKKINEIVSKRVDEVINRQLESFFVERDKKLETNPAKLNLVIIIAIVAIFFAVLFGYSLYMYFALEVLDVTLYIFILTEFMFLIPVLFSIKLIIKIIKSKTTLIENIIFSVMILAGVAFGILQFI